MTQVASKLWRRKRERCVATNEPCARCGEPIDYTDPSSWSMQHLHLVYQLGPDNKPIPAPVLNPVISAHQACTPRRNELP